MQSPASGNERSPGGYVVRLLAGALAALLGRAKGAELPEDQLLGWLRAKGLTAYPSPLLGPLLEELPKVLRSGGAAAAGPCGLHGARAGGAVAGGGRRCPPASRARERPRGCRSRSSSLSGPFSA